MALEKENEGPEIAIMRGKNEVMVEIVGDTHAYDGELNPMTFNHVRGSNAFDPKMIDIAEDGDDSWFYSNSNSTYQSSTDHNKSLFADS
jgi:hypothetical protein